MMDIIWVYIFIHVMVLPLIALMVWGVTVLLKRYEEGTTPRWWVLFLLIQALISLALLVLLEIWMIGDTISTIRRWG